MEEYLQLACINQENARRVVTDLQIEKLWGEIGAEINLVGSLKTGLLCKHRDIDFHVYTEKVTIAESFSVILKICKNPRVKKFWFKNLLNTGEDCLEWHLTYLDDNGKDWQIDIIHMPKGSRYDGYFENFANRLCEIFKLQTDSDMQHRFGFRTVLKKIYLTKLPEKGGKEGRSQPTI